MKERFFTFVLLVGGLGAIVLGVMLGQRIGELSDDALAWAGGSLFGCAVMLVPLAVLVGIAWFALRWKEASTAARPTVQQGNPPVIIVSGGQALPWYPQAQQQTTLPTSDWESISAPRKFEVIGGEDD